MRTSAFPTWRISNRRGHGDVKSPEKVDVVIVGSGAAGSVYAAILAEAGKSVLVLEKGTDRKLTDLYSSQIWARRLKWGAPHVFEEGKDSIWYNFNAGHGYGGAAMHHYAVWPRYHEDDMQEHALYGKGLDWPLEYDQLRPWYDQVQDDVGMSGDAEKEIWRPSGAPYPLPPLPVFEHGEILARGFTELDLRTSPIPVAILSREYKGRPACIYDSWCDAGCPTGALANPLVEYLPRAVKAGAVMQADSYVTRVLTDRNGMKATGVEYYDKAGERHEQPADAVVIAAFTVENSRILLNSATDTHAGGLGNSSGTLGRYLMSHPAVNVFGMFREETRCYYGVTGGQLFSQDGFEKEKSAEIFGSRQWEIGLGTKPNDLLGIAMSRADLFGNDLHDFVRRGSRHLGAMVGVCECLPHATNRIELSGSRDRFGMRLARVTFNLDDYARNLWRQTADLGVEIFKAAGATEAWHSPPGGQHIMGGTIMGNDRKSSVTNEYAQLHDVPNVIIGGPSVFPTSSSVNSTFTAHAVALRSARHIADHWSGLIA